ncbi:MAG: 6,7-dimethyl-8-ribityllumazine synthase [Bacteroidetes bacterium]|jgi:6,7-dimethyl-8-ribityllumazine synthase|nr:6,7-dimethyl-8-ribityllumazine synthase [Bacteroidota bacterium]
MATADTDTASLEQYRGRADFRQESIALIVAEWNADINARMYSSALRVLQAHGVKDIDRILVPGAYELPFAAQKMAYDVYSAIICFGTLIKGETRHDEYIATAVASGLMEVSLKHDKPVIFGVLTVNNREQALARTGGSVGDKGAEAAVSALKLLELARTYTGKYNPDGMVDAFYTDED